MNEPTDKPNPTTNIVALLQITLDQAGQVQVSGPIENRLLCFGLLEVAKATVQQVADKKQESHIIQPPPGLSKAFKMS